MAPLQNNPPTDVTLGMDIVAVVSLELADLTNAIHALIARHPLMTYDQYSKLVLSLGKAIHTSVERVDVDNLNPPPAALPPVVK